MHGTDLITMFISFYQFFSGFVEVFNMKRLEHVVVSYLKNHFDTLRCQETYAPQNSFQIKSMRPPKYPNSFVFIYETSSARHYISTLLSCLLLQINSPYQSLISRTYSTFNIVLKNCKNAIFDRRPRSLLNCYTFPQNEPFVRVTVILIHS